MHAAALELYGDVGWAGFTIDAVAARCRVGKAAIYRRWPTKERLLTDALESFGEQGVVEVTGDIRADLVTFVERLVATLAGPLGLVRLRAQLEARVYPEVLGAAMESSRRQWIALAREVIAGAVERGELPAGTSAALVFDAVRGMVINHFLHLSLDGTPGFVATRERLAQRIVDFVLDGARGGR